MSGSDSPLWLTRRERRWAAPARVHIEVMGSASKGLSLTLLPPRRFMRAPRALIPLSLIALSCACGHRRDTKGEPGTESSRPERADDSAVVQVPDPGLLRGWTVETFPLPPEFAPDLPTGHESLQFAPGWADRRAEDRWSYAFVMWIHESVPGPARVKELLEKYYDGLMSSFAAAKRKDASRPPARVEVVRTATSYVELKIHVIDAFATFEPIDLRVLVDAVAEGDEHSVLRIQVSPQLKEHAIWRSLQEAISSIVARDGASRGREGGQAPRSKGEVRATGRR